MFPLKFSHLQQVSKFLNVLCNFLNLGVFVIFFVWFYDFCNFCWIVIGDSTFFWSCVGVDLICKQEEKEEWLFVGYLVIWFF